MWYFRMTRKFGLTVFIVQLTVMMVSALSVKPPYFGERQKQKDGSATTTTASKEKDVYRLPVYCFRLQHEIQKAIMQHKWGLQNLNFQKRLKRHPQYIVTIQNINSQHEPLIELRSCPDFTTNGKNRASVEIYFHESRFVANQVRLFDIKSIFPVHSGSMSVKLNLNPLVMKVVEGSSLSQRFGGAENRDFVQFAHFLENNDLEEHLGKEHREETESVLDIEKEIEQIFISRIQPDIEHQLKELIAKAINDFFSIKFQRGGLQKNYFRAVV